MEIPSAPVAAESVSARRTRLGALGGVVLGLVLLVAGVLKSFDPAAFGEEIVRQKVSFGLPAGAAVAIALAIEIGLGTALVLNLRRRWVMAAATLLVAFFLVLTGRSAWKAAHGEIDDAESCGCFGALVDRTPGEALVQDLLLLAPALGLAWLGRPGGRRGVRARWAAVAIAMVATVVFAQAAPDLPLDDWATRLRPGVAIADLCAGRGDERVCLGGLAPELKAGTHLIVLADVRDPGFDALAARLNGYARAGGEPPVSVLADMTLDERQALFWRVAPAFVLHEIPRAILRPLYRRLPRAFRLEEGRVVETWAGLPESIPEAQEAR